MAKATAQRQRRKEPSPQLKEKLRYPLSRLAFPGSRATRNKLPELSFPAKEMIWAMVIKTLIVSWVRQNSLA